MLVSEETGIPIDRIAVEHGDTDLVPDGTGTFGSRSLQQGGAAVRQATVELVEIARRRAADLLEADPADVVVDTDRAVRRSNDWAIVAVAAVDGRVALANMGETPLRATASERALASGAGPADAAASAAEGTAPIEDMHADREYRRHLATVLTERALVTAAS